MTTTSRANRTHSRRRTSHRAPTAKHGGRRSQAVLSPSHSMARKMARRSQRRLSVFGVFVVAITLVFVGRLAQIQIVSSERYVQYGLSQRMKTVALAAERGTVFDRNGVPLAVTVPSKTIWANPKLIKNPYVTANAIAPIMQLEAAVVEQKLHQDSSFVFIGRQVDDETAKKVAELKLPGIFSIQEPKREQLGGELGSSILGRVGVDNVGLSGLEMQFNKQLAGKPGRLYAERDVAGNAIPGGKQQMQPSVQGNDLVLSIDQSLQQVTQKALSAQIVKASAKGGIAVVMQTQTGDILALSNLIRDSETGEIVEAPNNMAATNVYEPGSVNKMITVAAALEAGLVSPSTELTVPPTIRVADKVFAEHDPHPVQQWSTTDILANSSNVGTIQIAQNLGKIRLDSYMRKFGFGKKTAANFPGESAGILLQPKHWYPTSIGTIPIGQGVSVTALQMIAAYNTIANGGMYVEPRLVRSTIDGNGKQQEISVNAARRVVSDKTARQMTGMLNEVTRVGTGTLARIDGYTVAGKTGTARKPKLGGVGYRDGAYVSSFAGFVPAEKPQFTAMVILDEPTPIFGGLVSAPVFSQIMKYALGAYHIAPPDKIVMNDVPLANQTAVNTSEAMQARSTQPNKPTSATSTPPSGSTGSSTAGSGEPAVAPNRQKTTSTTQRATSSSGR